MSAVCEVSREGGSAGVRRTCHSARSQSLDLDIDVSDPPDLMEHLRKLADRCRAVEPG